MWADNETTKDLLNYEVHCNLLKEYLVKPELLPLTIGIFGDWGSGKSSIMRMLEESFKEDEKILTIYFNSWLFESYEDAKISLLENIILELSKGETLGAEAKSKILQLLSRVDYLKLASDGVKKYGKNIIDIIATGGIGTAIEAGYSMLKTTTLDDLKEMDVEKLNKYIKEEQENTSKTTIKSFKDDFSELISLTNYDSVVIFIDDLDRCLPNRVIDTLEAIKLFLSVDNTAFVIGADERILKHSISMHLKLHTFNSDSPYLEGTEQIVIDYIEKLIQIPYRIPKLSPSEIESYNNLLFCLNTLTPDDFTAVFDNYSVFKQENIYESYTLGNIKEIVNLEENPELNMLLHMSHTMSIMITNVLKGNPRQTKRFLNTYILRKKLANIANIKIEDFILIKLMLLEYFNIKLFNRLNTLQANNDGIVIELQMLESIIIDHTKTEEIEHLNEWRTEKVENWIKIAPRLGEVDLRDYFWLARDKTGSTLSDVHMVKPYIRQAYEVFISGEKAKTRAKIEEVKVFSDDDINDLISLYESSINNIQNIKSQLESLHELIIILNKKIFYDRYLTIIENTPYFKIEKLVPLPDRLQQVVKKDNTFLDYVSHILQTYVEQDKGLLKKASEKMLKKGLI